MSRNLLSEKALLTSLNISGWTSRRLDKRVTAEVNRKHGAAEDAGRYNKLLIAKEANAKLISIAGAARASLYEITLPWHDTGARILPTKLYDDLATKMRKFRHDYEAETETFIREYPNHIAEARHRLNGMFNPSDYPPAHQLRDIFKFKIAISPCPDAADYRVDLAAEQIEDLKQSLEADMRETLNNAMREPLQRIADVVGHMVERLNAYKPGKRDGTFRDSLVDNIRHLVTLLPAFNLTSDPKLDALTTRIEGELCFHDAQDLRDQPKTRRLVAKAAEAILVDVNDFMA